MLAHEELHHPGQEGEALNGQAQVGDEVVGQVLARDLTKAQTSRMGKPAATSSSAPRLFGSRMENISAASRMPGSPTVTSTICQE